MRRGRGRGRPLLRTARERPHLKRLSEIIGQPFPIPSEPGPPSPPASPNRPHYTRPYDRIVTRPGASRIDRSAGAPPHSPVRRVRHTNSRPGGTADDPPPPVRHHRIHLPKPTGHRRCPTPNESPSDCRDDSPHGTKSPGTGRSSPPGMRPRLSRSNPVLCRPVSFRPPAPNALYAFRKTRRTDGPAAASPYLNGPTFVLHGIFRSGRQHPRHRSRVPDGVPAPVRRKTATRNARRIDRYKPLRPRTAAPPRPKPAKDRAPRPSPETRYRSRQTSSILRPAQFSRIARSEAKPAIRLPQHGNVSRKRQAPSCRTEKRFRPTFIGPNA